MTYEVHIVFLWTDRSTHQSLKPDFLPEMFCLLHVAHLQPPIRYTTNIMISWLWTLASLPSVIPLDFPNTLSKRWSCTHFADEENWGSEMAVDAPKLTQLGLRKGKILTQTQNILWWADKRSCDPSIPNLRQQPNFPLSGASGLPQDDRASPSEILSKYRGNCHFFFFLEVKNLQTSAVSYGSI